MQNNLYIKRNPSNFQEITYFLIAFLLVGAHQFGFPLLPYLLVIFLGKNELRGLFKKKLNFTIIILLFSSLISLSIRGYPPLEAINVTRFFFGIPFIYLFLSFNLLSKLKYPVVIAYITWNLIELAITYITGNAPFYIENFALSTGAYNAAQITKVEETSRLLGPILNSSANGTISACILIASVFNKEIIFSNLITSKFKRLFVTITSSIIFLFSSSGTGFLIISILIFYKYIIPTILNFISQLRIKVNSLIFFGVGTSSLIYFLLLFPNFLKKYDLRYYDFIFNLKLFALYQFFEVRGIKVFFLGRNFQFESTFDYGDMVIIGLISSFGIFFLIFLLFIFFKMFNYERIYFLALLISCFHYGTLFTVTGQILSCIIFASKPRNYLEQSL